MTGLKLVPALGSYGPRDEEVAAMERRKAFPQPLISGDPGIMRRHQDQGATFGAPSPLKVEGRELKAQLARRREDERALGCLNLRNQNLRQDVAT